MIEFKRRTWKRHNKKTSFVYALCNPVGMEPFYVGVTCEPQKRLGFHVAEARRLGYGGKGFAFNDDKNKSIRAILAAGFAPCMAILEQTTVAREKAAEKRWAEALAAKGNEIVNTRALKLERRDLYAAVRLNYLLVELAETAAELLARTECEVAKSVSARIRERIAEADRMIESL